jgi:hypothetical protein
LALGLLGRDFAQKLHLLTVMPLICLGAKHHVASILFDGNLISGSVFATIYMV